MDGIVASRVVRPFQLAFLAALASWAKRSVVGRALTFGLSLALLLSLADWAIGPSKPAAAMLQPASAAEPDVPLSRPDEASALVTAKVTGRMVEVLSRRSETATVYALPNGSFEAQVNAGPVRFRDDAGAWVDVDIAMVRRPDGSVGPKAHPNRLVLAGAKPDGEHDLAVLGRGAEQVVLGWRGPLPEPVLEGPKATYVEVRPGVDLVVEASRTGFEQLLVVKTRLAAAALAKVEMPWRSALTTFAVGKGLGLRDPAGRDVWVMPPPEMWDASTVPETGDHKRRSSVAVATAARPGGRTDLVLTPDAAFLSDPATTYPVTIDPVVTPAPLFDTYVQTGVTTSQHTSMELRLGTTTSGSATARSFMRFDMSPVYGTTISSAQLNMYETESNACNTASWELWYTGFADYTTVWSNQPGWVSHYHSSASGCGEGWTSIPATTWVQNVADWQYQFMTMGLKATSETAGSGSWKKFHSSEWAWGIPHLAITYHLPAQVLGRATNPPTTCVTGAGRPYLNSTTPTLSAQPWDPEGAAVSAQFEWWVTGGGAPIGSATVGPGASGSWLSTVVPAGAFANGGTYSWRARAFDGGRWGPWSSWCEFVVDTSEPAVAPGVSATVYPERPPTPTGYISAAETRTYEAGTSALPLTGDDAVASVGLPFPFTFFGQSYTSVWVDTNGKLYVTNPGASQPQDCAALPNAATPNGGVYGFCENLVVDASAGMYTAVYGTAPDRHFVVEWRNVRRFDSATERLSMTVSLYENGEIAVNYDGINPASNTERGGEALVGVEDPAGAKAEQYSRNTPNLADDAAVVFRPGVLPPTSYTKTTVSQAYVGAAGGTVLPLTGDDGVTEVSLPFPVNLYGRVHTTAWVDINGLVAFANPGQDTPLNSAVPSAAAPNAALYPFWDDLVVNPTSTIRTMVTGTAPTRQFVVDWNNINLYGTGLYLNVEVVIAESGVITYRYADIATTKPQEQGVSATVGIEDWAGTSGIQHSYNQAVLVNGTAIVFTPVVGGGATSTGGANIPGTFTFTASGMSDVASYQWGLDATPSTVVNASALGGTGTATVTPPSDGPHVVNVRSQDRAGNQSPIYAYHFFAGPGGLTAPKPGDVTAAQMALVATGHPAATGVTYQWRRADTDVWADIPTAFVTYAVGGGSVYSWPIVTTGSGAFLKLNWNVEATLTAADAEFIARDGPLQVRAVFSGLDNGAASPVKITFDRNQATAASQNVGPGSVNLITGNATLSDTDVSVDSYGTDLTVTRTFNTRQATRTDSANMFGPGWVSGTVVAAADALYTELTVYGSLVQIGLPDGSTIGFTARTATDFDPEIGLEYLELTRTGSSYTLTDEDGNTVVFTQVAGAAAGHYHPTAVTVPGSGQTTTLSWEKVNIAGADVTRPTRMLAPVPAGVNCTTLTRGCRALTFTYSTATTASGTAEAQWGDYVGRVKEISVTAWDPDLPTPGMRTVVLARYSYDNAGRLRAVWDPRLDYLDGGATKHLWDRYGYDADGVVTTVTPAGQEPWQLFYTTIPGDSGKGRLAAVTRSALSAGTATTTVVYKVPVPGAGSPYDMSGGQTARWGQAEPPVSATAVFPPTQIPDGNQATGALPSSYERASVTYLDANARTVNAVVPGGFTTTTWYDQYGNTTRTLVAGNRARALSQSGSDTPEQEAALADKLATLNVYSTDGQRLLHTYGPIHDVTQPDGTVVRGRAHTANTYDEGAPATGAPYNVVTTQVDSVHYTAPAGDSAEADLRVTKTEYDWTLRQPTASIVDPTGMSLKTRTAYDPITGLVVATTTPPGGEVDTTPATRKTIYYRATVGSGYAECDLRPEWANMPCRVQPGGQPASGPELSVTVSTYDIFNQPRSVTEKTSAGVLRTTTTTYDVAGRVYEVSVTAAAGLGEPVPTRRNVYDQQSGTLARSQSMGSGGTVTAEIVRVHDTLGRLTSYTDADGNVSTTTYDLLGRAATTFDGKATRTYIYDGGTERRGLPTGVTDTQGGTFAGTYDTDGRLVSETWPDGIVAATTYDETGTPVGLTYTKPGCGQPDCTLYSEAVGESAHGQWRSRNSTMSGQAYSYDVTGRLTEVRDTVSGQCTTRTYAFADLKSYNRTGLTTYAPDGATGACQTSTAAGTQTSTYDTADRITTAGTVYDALGRTTTVPAADTTNPAGGNLTVGYHHTDLVRSITQGLRTTDYTIDVTGERIRSWTDNVTGGVVTKRHHYAGDSDNPAWTQEDAAKYTRTITGLGGMAGTFDGDSLTVDWQLANLHGDLVCTVHGSDPGLSATYEANEHGTMRNSADTGTRRYGWLGTKQRAADTPSGVVLMGVRLYNGVTGRFLQVDPIYRGNATAYDYCSGDPINCVDLDGRWGWKSVLKKAWGVTKVGLGYATILGCTVCGAILVVDAAVNMIYNFRHRQYGEMAWNALDIVSFGYGQRVKYGLKASKTAIGRFTRKEAAATSKAKKAQATRNLERAERREAFWGGHEAVDAWSGAGLFVKSVWDSRWNGKRVSAG